MMRCARFVTFFAIGQFIKVCSIESMPLRHSVHSWLIFADLATRSPIHNSRLAMLSIRERCFGKTWGILACLQLCAKGGSIMPMVSAHLLILRALYGVGVIVLCRKSLEYDILIEKWDDSGLSARSWFFRRKKCGDGRSSNIGRREHHFSLLFKTAVVVFTIVD